MAAGPHTLDFELHFTHVVIARFETRAHFPGFDPVAETPASLDPRPAIFLRLTALRYRVFVDFGEEDRRLSIAFFGKGNGERGALRSMLKRELEAPNFSRVATQDTHAAWREGELLLWNTLVSSQPAQLKAVTDASLVAVRERLTLRDGGSLAGRPISAGASESRTIEAARLFKLALEGHR